MYFRVFVQSSDLLTFKFLDVCPSTISGSDLELVFTKSVFWLLTVFLSSAFFVAVC